MNSFIPIEVSVKAFVSIMAAVMPYFAGGCLTVGAASGCTVFEKGSIVVESGTLDQHVGKSFGLNYIQDLHIGFGFDEGYTDTRLEGSGSFELQKQDPTSRSEQE